MTERRITVSEYTLVIPENGRATLLQADLGGDDHELPWGAGSAMDALIVFAGEIELLRKSWGDDVGKILGQVKENKSIIDDATARLDRAGL